MYFSEETIAKLSDIYKDVENKEKALQDAFTSRVFQNEKAKEYAVQGFLRRFKTLVRCIHNVYRICPPNWNERLSSKEQADLVINLQAFVFNAFGCLDNLAWIWVKEKDVKNSKGNDLSNFNIGLSEKKRCVWKSFPEDFQNYLNDLDQWFAHLEVFRHALAHRIPLYVPPYVVNEEEAFKVQELEELKLEAIRNENFGDYKNLTEQLEGIGNFIPWMLHSFGEESPRVVFHPQILEDLNTIVGISEKFLEELNK